MFYPRHCGAVTNTKILCIPLWWDLAIQLLNKLLVEEHCQRATLEALFIIVKFEDSRTEIMQIPVPIHTFAVYWKKLPAKNTNLITSCIMYNILSQVSFITCLHWDTYIMHARNNIIIIKQASSSAMWRHHFHGVMNNSRAAWAIITIFNICIDFL